MSILSSGKLSRLLSRLGTPDSGDVATKIDTLHDTRITSARAAKLDNCDASVAAVKTTVDANLDAKVSDIRTPVVANLDAKVSAAITKPPIALSGRYSALRGDMSTFLSGVVSVLTQNTFTLNVWGDVVSYSGSGIIELSAVAQNLNTNAVSFDARLLIDGVQVWLKTGAFTATADNDKGYFQVGSGTAFPALGAVKFNTGFNLQCRPTSTVGGQITMGGYLLYQRWT